MLPQVLPFLPEQDQHAFTVTLDGEQFDFVLTYRDRLASWYVDIDTADGTPLVRGRRVSPGFHMVPAGTVGRPKGLLTSDGDDPYGRADIRLLYYTEAQLAAA